MRFVLYICSILLLVAAGYVIETSFGGLSPLYDQFAAQPFWQKTAWVVLLAALVLVVVVALWQSDKVAQQSKAIDTLEKRLGLKGLEQPQGDIDSVSNYLMQSDPDDAMGKLKQRLVEVGHNMALQESRNDAADFGQRVEDIRKEQGALRERLGGVVAKRRGIDQIIAELEREQKELERSLEEFDRGEGKGDFKTHVRDLAEFVGETHARLNEVERALATLEELKNGFSDFQVRLTRLEAPEDGVKALAHEVRNVSERLSISVERLEWDNDVTLKDRLQKLADKRQDLDRRIATLAEEFASLESIRKDVTGMFLRLSDSINSYVPR